MGKPRCVGQYSIAEDCPHAHPPLGNASWALNIFWVAFLPDPSLTFTWCQGTLQSQRPTLGSQPASFPALAPLPPASFL